MCEIEKGKERFEKGRTPRKERKKRFAEKSQGGFVYTCGRKAGGVPQGRSFRRNDETTKDERKSNLRGCENKTLRKVSDTRRSKGRGP